MENTTCDLREDDGEPLEPHERRGEAEAEGRLEELRGRLGREQQDNNRLRICNNSLALPSKRTQWLQGHNQIDMM